MQETYTAPEFTVICFATEDAITQSGDTNVDIEDIVGSLDP